jgi:hypothetical protein
MYVKLNCLFVIYTKDGDTIRFDAVNSVDTDRSLDKICSTAKFKIPTSSRLVRSKNEFESVQTSKVFGRGDKIYIQLGYDDRMYEEFEGFISKVNFTQPLEIECQGYEFLLNDTIPTKTYKSTNLKEVLSYIIHNTDIRLDGNIPEVNMQNYVIPANLKRIDALQQLKERYGLTVYFLKNVLFAGLDFQKYLGTVKYSLGINTPKADELKYQTADEVKLKIKAIQINKDNSKIEAEFGDKEGEQRTLYFYTAKDKKDLEKLAFSEMKKYKYDGFVGKLTTFLEPYSTPGMVAQIIDERYPERSGKYEIRSVTVSFGTSGARRIVEIGKTVSL